MKSPTVMESAKADEIAIAMISDYVGFRGRFHCTSVQRDNKKCSEKSEQFFVSTKGRDYLFVNCEDGGEAVKTLRGRVFSPNDRA